MVHATRIKTIFLTLFGLILATSNTSAQTKDWLDLVKAALKGAKKGHAAMNKVVKIVKDIEETKPPDPNPKDEWSNLAQKYRDAAEAVHKLPVVPDFDKTPYSITVEELRNCD